VHVVISGVGLSSALKGLAAHSNSNHSSSGR
jgi:hypothetical protein